MKFDNMKYCSQCGDRVSEQVPAGDDRPRWICVSCEFIHYQNPNVVVGSLPTAGSRILLCKRAIEPQKGLWTLPAGFLENGETMQEGALRETWEEAQAKLDNVSLYRLFDLPYINQIYVFYRGELAGDYASGPESLDVQLFEEQDIPWAELAFPVITDALEEFFKDRHVPKYPVRVSKPSKRWLELQQQAKQGDQ